MTNHPNRSAIPTVSLFGEDGIAIYLSEHHDICDRADAVVRVVGRAIYDGSVVAAEQSIRRAYLAKAGIADPVA